MLLLSWIVTGGVVYSVGRTSVTPGQSTANSDAAGPTNTAPGASSQGALADPALSEQALLAEWAKLVCRSTPQSDTETVGDVVLTGDCSFIEPDYGAKMWNHLAVFTSPAAVDTALARPCVNPEYGSAYTLRGERWLATTNDGEAATDLQNAGATLIPCDNG